MNEYNASDTKAVRRAAKLAKQALAERQAVVFNLMSSPAGRSYMYDRLVRCHMFSSSFNAVGLVMAFSEGERNIGLQDLADIMQAAPNQYVQMMREQSDKEIADGRRDDSGHSGRDAQRGRDDLGRADDAGGSVTTEWDPIDGVGDDAVDGQGRAED